MKTGLKIALGAFVYGLTIAVVLAGAAFWWLAAAYTAPGPLTETTLFNVERGEGLKRIAYKLEDNHIIDSRYVFIAGAMALGTQSQLQAGEYEFAPGSSARAIMHKIHTGDIVQRRVTIREGLTIYEIQRMISEIPDITQERMEPVPEGSLLPQTYNYQLKEKAGALQARMSAAMSETLDELWESRDDNLPFTTKHEALTLASIVEKETGVPEERRRVAGVFINRLRQGIALQTDPTVIYALTKGKPKNEGKGPLGRRLTTKDLETDSPYNTYKYPGLPPGPIACPGRESIEAVLHPEIHDFIYFVADGTGGHVFATTLAEHNANVTKWRKIRKEQKR